MEQSGVGKAKSRLAPRDQGSGGLWVWRPGGAESDCCRMGFGWTREGAELNRPLSSVDSRLAQGRSMTFGVV